MQEDRFRDQLNSSSDEPDSVSQVVTLDEATSGNEETFEPLQQQKSHPRITYAGPVQKERDMVTPVISRKTTSRKRRRGIIHCDGSNKKQKV